MSRTMKLGSVLLLTAFVLLVGVVCGVLVDRLVMQYHFAHRMRARMEEHVADRLQKDLDLTPAQRAQVDSVFREQGGRIERLRHEVDHLFAARQDSFEMALSKVLTPAQLDKLHKMIPRRPPGFLRMFGPPWGGRHHGEGRPPEGPMGPGPGPGPAPGPEPGR